jgi:hypothetical protein
MSSEVGIETEYNVNSNRHSFIHTDSHSVMNEDKKQKIHD